MGSWYKEAELGKRAAIFSASAQAGTLFSGVLQAALYTNLNGRGGLAGWQWVSERRVCRSLCYGPLLTPPAWSCPTAVPGVRDYHHPNLDL